MDLSNITKYWNIEHAAKNKFLVINTITFLHKDGDAKIKYEGEDFIRLCKYV